MKDNEQTKEGAKSEFHRNFLRVHAAISFRLHPVTPEEHKRAMEQGIISSTVTRTKLVLSDALDQSQDLSKESKRVFEKFFELLMAINTKLDTLLETLVPKPPEDLTLRDREVDISGGGFYFEIPEAEARKIQFSPQLGSALKLELCLPSVPPNVIVCYGEIRWTERVGGGKWGCGVAFSVISEDDRQEIVRFVTLKERAMLQARRKQ